MKSQIRITIYRSCGEYFASMTALDNVPNFSPPDTIFSLTEEIEPSELQNFRNRAKEEARRRGIAHVINLD